MDQHLLVPRLRNGKLLELEFIEAAESMYPYGDHLRVSSSFSSKHRDRRTIARETT
jgi:hypothetical protein